VDGKVVYRDCSLRVWDVDGKQPGLSVATPPTPLGYGLFTNDGNSVLYAVPTERVLHQLDLTTTLELDTFKKMEGPTHAADMAPSGKWLVTRRYGTVVAIWDAAAGTKLKEWTFQETVTCATVSPDSRYLAIGLITGVVYVLRLDDLPGKS
jgi:WD40 repeat protein